MIRSAKTIKRIVGGVLLVSAACSGTLHAAGLGKLSTTSALGQPLQAEIELVSLQPGEFESLTARVASPDSYRDARIEYTSVLRQIRFAVERRASGQPVLKLSTVAPINEPFLDVLVELNWPAGRLLREYPILLDPPGFNEARPPAAAPAAVAPQSPQVATVAPPKAVDPVKPSVAASAPPAKAAASTPDTYTVQKGDTLNKIAGEVKSESVSLEQMLVALYRENQAAFIDNNMNRLKSGQILRVPAATDVAKITNSEAKKEIRVQVENWKNYRDSVAGSVASTAPGATPANQASGRIATSTPSAPVGAPSKDVLKLSKADVPASKAGPAASKADPGAQNQINALKEDAIAREGALKEAKSRVAELEKQIQDMRKLMELKGVTPPGKPSEPVKPVAKPDDKKTPEPAKPDTKVAQVTPAKAVEPAKPAEKLAEPAKVEPAKADPAKPVEPPKVADAKPADKPKPVPSKAKAAPPPPPEPSVVDMAMEYAPYAAGGLGVLAIGAFGFVYLRKRKAKSSSAGPFTSAASSVLPSDLKPPTTTSGKATGGLIDTGNSSFLTDFDKQGAGTIDTDEVDPVAEAEVYIAYGRDAQAEEILKEAMGRDKSRHEITLKLLEIYHTRKSTQAFETLAREFRDTVGKTSPAWARAAAMGAQLDPANPLYAGFASQDLGATAALPAMQSADAGKGNPPDLDFDLGFSSDAAKPSVDVSLDTPLTQPDMDLGFDLDLSGPDSAAPASMSTSIGDGFDLDISLDKTAVNTPPAAPPMAAPTKADTGFDFDLSSLSLDSGEDKTMAATSAEHEKTAAFNLGDISLDLDTGPGSASSTAPAGGGDASSTKLELARAYVEIGDKDGAKEILQEVMREGSAAQKQEAQALMSSL